MSALTARVGPAKSSTRESLWLDAWRRLIRNRMAVVGLLIIGGLLFTAVFAAWIAPHDPLQIYDGQVFLPPPWAPAWSVATAKVGDPRFLLGTDGIGRDILSRVIYGARVSVVVALVPTTVSVVIGLLVGLAAGYMGGWVDNLLMRLTDVVWSFPDLLFFIVVMVSLRDTPLGDLWNGLFLLFGALSVISWVGIARLMRGQALSLREKEFIEAARAIGASDRRIMFRHVLPNSLGPLVVSITFAIPSKIIAEAVLGYLGLGLRPGTDPREFFVTSWGALLLQGQTALNTQPWLLLAPAVCVALVVMAFTFVGDGLRDALDPRMRGTS